MLARAREHDRREPPADRHRVVARRLHRVLPVARSLAAHDEGSARALTRRRGDVPRHRDDLLVDAPNEGEHHAGRRRDPRVDLRGVHDPRVARARGGTTSRRAGTPDRHVPHTSEAAVGRPDVHLRGDGDPARCGGVRGGARRDGARVPQQREELLLTAAQSFFALAVLLTLSITTREAILLFTLFWAQFIIGALVPESLQLAERVGVSAVYILLGLVIFVRDRHLIVPLVRDGLVTPYKHLNAAAEMPG